MNHLRNKLRWMSETALLSTLITLSGAIKIPGFMPGTEFQLSAPLAVSICSVFGFTQYISAGILSSMAGLILGTQNLLNVYIAFLFRLTVGIVLTCFGTSRLVVVIAGPLGSAAARLALAGVLGKGALPLLVAAIPGMVYTAMAAWPLVLIIRRCKTQTEKVLRNAVQR
jgi:hypothetical protein